ncbi:hypothetical protein OG535_39935 [Kitasatospora sp. NBC_00085]|uniref:hypothetical protein n=1 Tax=unclassified Kitasatospora TaxID=2633591 RepID=UPI0032519E15
MAGDQPPNGRPAGARTATDIHRAIDELSAGTQSPTQSQQGALAAYQWVLGHGRAPVTGANLIDAVPTETHIHGEERAALRQAHDLTRPISERSYAFGATQALAWILGYTDDQPQPTRREK